MRKTFLIASLFVTTAAFAQQDLSKVEIKAQKVAGSVYMLTGAGGNIGVSVGDDGIVMIDDQYAPMAPKIRTALKAITDKPLRFVINTHYHGDHTGGNESFAGEAPVIAHENARKRMQTGGKGRFGDIPAAPKGGLPIVTFDNRLTIHANGEDIRALHLPNGHTDGDAAIWFTASNVVHMGDDFFNGFFPFVDAQNGGSVRGLLGNVEKVLTTINDTTKVIPGHGPLSDKAGLRAFADVLRATIGAVETAHKAGRTVEQMKSDKILAQWDKWGQGFIKTDMWIDIVYTDVTGK